MHHARMTAVALSALVLTACGADETTTGPRAVPAPSLSVGGHGNSGAVYTLSNAVAGNAVLAFDRAPDGSLTPAGSYPTDGTGTGGGLGNQGAVILTQNGRYLFAVNPGSDEVTSFTVEHDGALDWRSTVSSGGVMPVSVTASGRIVYVLNAGGTGNITGFRVAHDGTLSMIAGSSRPLSGGAAGAAQIEFDPSGRVLIVTEKATNKISTYTVGRDGLASGPIVHTSNGMTPFGFALTNTGVLIVSEAFGGAPNASAASSYTVGRDGSLALVSASVPTTETAACWFVVTNNNRFAYTTNTGSGTITGFQVSHGALSRLDADGVTATVGAGTAPIDLALSRNSRFVYSLNSGNETITLYAIGADGSLAPLSGGVSGLPNGATGLAAR